MTKEVNAMPFTTRLNYNVEEISMDEFIAAVNHSSQIESEVLHMRALRAKATQYQQFLNS